MSRTTRSSVSRVQCPRTRESRPASAQLPVRQTDLQGRSGYRIVIHDRVFIVFCLVAVLPVLCIGNFGSIYAVYVTDFLGIPYREWGYLLALNAGIVAVVQYPLVRALRRRNRMVLLAISSALLALGIGGSAFAASLWSLVFLIAVLSVGETLLSPVASAEVAAQGEGVTLAVTDLAVALAADATGGAALAGQTITYTLTVTNSGAYSDTYTLSWDGNLWPVEVSPVQTPELAPGGAAHVVVSVHVPDSPTVGVDTVTVRATSSWDGAVYAEQSLVTRAVTGLAVALAADTTDRSALPGQVVTYTLTVSNTGAYSDTYTLSWAGNLWPVEVSPAQTPELAPGGAAHVVVNVHVPASPAAEVDMVTVRATSSWDAAVFAEQSLVTRRRWGVYLPLIVR